MVSSQISITISSVFLILIDPRLALERFENDFGDIRIIAIAETRHHLIIAGNLFVLPAKPTEKARAPIHRARDLLHDISILDSLKTADQIVATLHRVLQPFHARPAPMPSCAKSGQ